MDDLEDLQASEFVTDTEDQDSLDERIDSEQRLRNQQLWASFQNAACCITKLYKDRAQPNISPWTPFQNAASNLTTLYKDCIESQRRFARIGYQVGRRKRVRELSKLLKKHKLPTNKPQHQHATTASDHATQIDEDSMMQLQSSQQQNVGLGSVGGANNESSILNVNQLNLGCDDSVTTNSMQSSSNHLMHLQSSHHHNHHHQLQQQQQQQQAQSQHQQSTAIQQQANLQILLGNNEDDLLTFQQALTQPAIRGIKSSQNRRPCSNSPGYLNNRTVDPKSEEDKLLELNQFLSEEYHRHVGSKKRSCSTLGGSSIKRLRE